MTARLVKVRVRTADLDVARSVSGLLGEVLQPEPLAVSVFEAGAPVHVVEAYYERAPDAAAIERALAELGGSARDVEIEEVPDENWVAVSQAALPPVRADRFVVHGSHDRQRIGMRPGAIEIEAGEAFGTGHNATTSGCLEAIGMLSRRRSARRRVLDLGCGTGVLAIAAARAYPRARCLAVDNDPLAVAIARDNVRLNRATGQVRVFEATGFRHRDLRGRGAFDLILANILPRPLVALAHDMRAALVPGGIAVLSGLLNHQAGEVIARYRAAGFRLLRARSQGGWTVLTLQRLARRPATIRIPIR